MLTPAEVGLYSTDELTTLTNLKAYPLFWFLKDTDIDSIQHQFTDQSITLSWKGRQVITLSVTAETLAANPEDKLNEDSFLILSLGETRVLFAVLDGASSQKEIAGLTPYGISGAFYVSHLVSRGFADTPEHRQLSQTNGLTAGEVMRCINTWLYPKMKSVVGVDYDDVLTIPGMAATLAVTDIENHEVTIAHVADTVAAALYQNGWIELLTPNQNESYDRETMNFLQTLAVAYQGNLAQALKDPEIKARKKIQLQESFRRKINQPGGCGILNGMPELESHNLISEHNIPLTDNLRSILLLSDGALLPYLETGLQTEVALENLIKNISVTNRGPMLHDGVARLDQDLDFKRIPRLKHRDDATVMEILFSLN